MTEFTYTYSISLDFPLGFDPGQFTIEVENSSLGPIFLRVDTSGDNCYVIFSASLTGPQVIILNGLVAAHNPAPTNIIFDAPGYAQFMSELSDSQAVQIKANDVNGGIYIYAGDGGIDVETTNAFVVSSGAVISLTTTLGNVTIDTPALFEANAVSGINIGNDADAAPINIGTGASTRTITVGNNTGATRIFEKWGTGGYISYQPAPIALADAAATVTIANLLVGLLTISPTVDRNITLPTAALAVAGISTVSVDDCIDFRIMHLSTGVADPVINVLMGAGGSAVGNMSIYPSANNAGTYNYSGTATFRMRFTNVGSGTETYSIYRIS